MEFKNILFIYHPLEIYMESFLKEKISTRLELSIEDCCFKKVVNGFEFIWNGETEGIVRITSSNCMGSHLLIEGTNSRETVEAYILINGWITEALKLK